MSVHYAEQARSSADHRDALRERADSAGQKASAKLPALKALPKIRRRQQGLLAAISALLLIALGVVLAVNIHVANSQYAVVQMQNEHRELVQQNESLTQQIQFRESPQSLSNSAVGLGMVIPASAGTFELDSAAITGSAAEASSSDRPSNYVSAPMFPGEEATVGTDLSEQAADAPTGILGAGAWHTLGTGSAGQNETGSDDAGGDADHESLNGGTIPAPDLGR